MVPAVVRECRDSWRRALPSSWTIEELSDESPLLAALASRSGGLHRQQFTNTANFSDWLRLELLGEFGGVWLDSSVLLNSSTYIQNLHEEACAKGVEIAGFSNSVFQTLPAYPVLENWAIMAPPQSSFIKEWRDEHALALRTGFTEYKEKLLAAKLVNPQRIYLIGREYLTMHVCAQVVLQQKRAPLSPRNAFALIKDAALNNGPLALHFRCERWKFWCIGDMLADTEKRAAFDVIKLTSSNRTWYAVSSHMRRFLGDAPLSKVTITLIIFVFLYVSAKIAHNHAH